MIRSRLYRCRSILNYGSFPMWTERRTEPMTSLATIHSRTTTRSNSVRQRRHADGRMLDITAWRSRSRYPRGRILEDRFRLLDLNRLLLGFLWRPFRCLKNIPTKSLPRHRSNKAFLRSCAVRSSDQISDRSIEKKIDLSRSCETRLQPFPEVFRRG